MHKFNKKGFTLLEILLVIGLIAILAGIVIVAINPGRQITQANDTQRVADVNTILNAVYQYTIDNNGQFPEDTDGEEIDNTSEKILGTSDGTCSALTCTALTTNADCIDLTDDLVTNVSYITSMPINPGNTGITYDAINSGYTITKDGNRITVQSCENDVDGNAISVTR